MDKHIFVSNVVVKKANDGGWFVSKVFTSVGNFDLGQEVNKGLDQSKIETTIDEIKTKIIPQIQSFIKSEVEEEAKRKNKK